MGIFEQFYKIFINFYKFLQKYCNFFHHLSSIIYEDKSNKLSSWDSLGESRLICLSGRLFSPSSSKMADPIKWVGFFIAL